LFCWNWFLGATSFASTSERTTRAGVANTASYIVGWPTEQRPIWADVLAVDSWRHQPTKAECQCTTVTYQQPEWTPTCWVSARQISIVCWRQDIGTSTSKSMYPS